MRFGLIIAAFALATVLGAVPGHAEKRVALVIGNGAYVHAQRLPNPRNDAEDVAAALRRGGFETIVGTDLDKAGMDDATGRFARAARSADVAVFYYSGHAMQFGGVNYLMPVGARLTDEVDLRHMARVDEIVADLQLAKNLRILVLDSCRDNPLAEQLKRSIGLTRAASIQRGLARIDSPEGMIVAYSTQAGRTADDGNGRNSPYTTAFLKHIEEKDEIGTLFRLISADVYEATNRTQLPELSLSFIGQFYLNGPISVSVNPPVQLPAVDRCAAAETHWKGAEAIASVVAFEDHLARFPNCAFAGLAKARIENLKSKEAVVAPPVAPTVPVMLQMGLVAYWPLDSDTTSWTTNTTRDVSGNGNTGAMVRMSATNSSVPGKIGGALKFNGRNHILSSTNPTAISSGTAYSLAVWLKTASPNSGWACLVAYSHTTALQYIGIAVERNKLAFFNKDDVGNTEALGANVDSKDGKWHHIVGTRNGNSYNIYVDGSNASSANNPTLGTITPNCFSMGFNCHRGGMFYYNGVLDDVRVYNRALSAQEVAQLYSMGQ
jgi:hypothetical protein